METKLEFPRDWGLGSSSTLINNIAQWAQIDAFKLLFESFGAVAMILHVLSKTSLYGTNLRTVNLKSPHRIQPTF